MKKPEQPPAPKATASIESLANAPRLEQVHDGIRASLVLDPNPGSLGGDVAGFVDVALPYGKGTRFFVWLDWVGDYSKSSSANWVEGGYGVAEAGPAGTRIRFRFTPGAEQRPSGEWVSRPGDFKFGEHPHHVRWHVVVEAKPGGGSWSFEIPVAEGARPSPVFAELPDTGKSGAPHIPGDLVYRVAGASALVLEEPPQIGLGGMLIGMTVGGGIMWASAGSALGFGAIWFFLGAAIAFGSVYGFGLRIRVEVRPGLVALRKSWFGIAVGSRDFAGTHISAVSTRVAAQTPHELSQYKMLLLLRDGQDVELIDDIKDSRQAEALRRMVEERLRGAQNAELERLLAYRAAG
jgi:hypothetical protein